MSTMLTLVPQQSPLLLSMACFVLQQNFHHSGPLPFCQSFPHFPLQKWEKRPLTSILRACCCVLRPPVPK